MVKQDKNRSPNSNQTRKPAQGNPQGSYKKKASENDLQHENQKDFMQGAESQDEKRKSMSREKHPEEDFDHSEGEGRSQKS